jgi:transposase
MSYTRQGMKNVQPISSRKASDGREERSSTASEIAAGSAAVARQHELIKMAIDMHSRTWVISRQLDNATPQPPQTFSPQQAMAFIAKQVKLAGGVVCCYEAGCFGYGPQRQIAALGAQCLVIAPQNWDERNKNVRTDKTDTMAMVQKLDRYVAGNRKALAVVRVPSLAEEVARSRVRQRHQFMNDRNRQANRGKSLLLNYSLPSSWSWWKPDNWERTQKSVREMGEHGQCLLEQLQRFHNVLMTISEELAKLTTEQEKRQKERRQCRKSVRLRGIGDLSMAVIESEIMDWNRFSNRRQVSSYTGLCPGVTGTAGNFTNLSVNKCGNPRLRAMLVELAWLLPRYQPKYRPLLRWKEVLSGTNRSAKKKAVVALARRLAVDLWRIHTGRTTPEKLGLELAA